jgi:uncharacterized Zn-finger protein
LKELRRAHQLLESGDHANAAVLFERLAASAHDRGVIRLAPQLYFQAGRARLLSGDLEEGKKQILVGLGLLADEERWDTLQRSGGRLEQEIPDMGYTQLAEEVGRWIEDALTKEDAPSLKKRTSEAEAQRRGLPLTCPKCAGPLHPVDVDWFDSKAAECPYCGGLIKI